MMKTLIVALAGTRLTVALTGTFCWDPYLPVCSDKALSDVGPVCGSDFKTYNSLCVLTTEACEQRRIDPLSKPLVALFQGDCKNKLVKPECHEICSNTYNPVCGSD
eukprot:Ihof_evm2s881 gene=Ihof_evmTU2s881